VVGAPINIASTPGWPHGVDADSNFKVTLAGKTMAPVTLSARAGEPLIASLERHGIVIKNSCRSGECSLCRTKLLSGQVFHPPGVPIRQSDRQYGYIHPCMAYPVSDLELLL